jgi:hypothetical protein
VLERDYQAGLIKRLKRRFPGCFILKNDTEYCQGVPDLLVLYETMWAMLEVKRKRPTKESDFEPNQEWYISMLNSMSYAACIYPENEEEVLDDLQRAFEPDWSTREIER